MARKIRKGDPVLVMAGKEKGKRGEVLSVDTKRNRAVVSGLNRVIRHQKQSERTQGGRISKEAPIHLSNLMLIDPAEDRPTRVGFRFEEREGELRKVRYAKLSGQALDG